MYSQLNLLTINAGSELVRSIRVILINILAACVIGDLGSTVYHLSAVVQILLFPHSQSQCATSFCTYNMHVSVLFHSILYRAYSLQLRMHAIVVTSQTATTIIRTDDIRTSCVNYCLMHVFHCILHRLHTTVASLYDMSS